MSPGLVARAILAAVCATLVGAAGPAGAQGYGLAPGDRIYDTQALRVLAEQGDKRAAFLLGSRYASGDSGIVKDDSEAVRWFTLAAEGGLAEAQYNLGIMFASGRGTKRDLRQAANWYQRAAEQGLAEAQFNLGTLYGTGNGVPRDEALAAKWLALAAARGLPQAQYNLGVLYEHGRGVRLNARTALEWYQRAAEQGFDPAKVRHAALEKKMAAPGTTAPPGQASAPAAPAPAAAPSPATAEKAPDPVPAAQRAPGPVADAHDWLAAEDPSRFTVQLASYPDQADARRLAEGLPVDPPVGIYSSTKRGKVWYSVVQGSYASHEQAKAAVDGFPEPVRQMKPWIRKIALIHKEMR